MLPKKRDKINSQKEALFILSNITVAWKFQVIVIIYVWFVYLVTFEDKFKKNMEMGNAELGEAPTDPAGAAAQGRGEEGTEGQRRAGEKREGGTRAGAEEEEGRRAQTGATEGAGETKRGGETQRAGEEGGERMFQVHFPKCVYISQKVYIDVNIFTNHCYDACYRLPRRSWSASGSLSGRGGESRSS